MMLEALFEAIYFTLLMFGMVLTICGLFKTIKELCIMHKNDKARKHNTDPDKR